MPAVTQPLDELLADLLGATLVEVEEPAPADETRPCEPRVPSAA